MLIQIYKTLYFEQSKNHREYPKEFTKLEVQFSVGFVPAERNKIGENLSPCNCIVGNCMTGEKKLQELRNYPCQIALCIEKSKA